MSATAAVQDQAPEKAPNEQLLTAELLADRWGVNKSAVYRWVREGLLDDCVTKLGRRRRFRLDRVESFEARGGTGGLS